MHSSKVIERISERMFGKPILRNDIRGEVVEEMVAMALEPDWELCAGDWAAFDLQHRTSKLRMQVKQSAARQSWHSGTCPIVRPCFSIAEKTGRWEGATWIAEPGRNADIYVFGWHPLTEVDADHRDPDQWLFYVVAAPILPTQKTISLTPLRKLASPTSFANLGRAVRACCASTKLKVER